jgi:ABC-2 type transport system ATP-binding protein
MRVPAIEAYNLHKTYGKFTAVAALDLVVQPGEIVGFLGPNGAGKTTTLKMLTGLLRPTSGTVRICGFDMQTEPLKAKACLGYVPDTPNLYAKLTALEYLRFVAKLYRVPSRRSEPHIAQLLDKFGLSEAANDTLGGFSHGMQQKIAITAALLHEPKVLFLDEPTVGLDPRSARLIKDLLIQLRNQGAAVMFSTHILEIAERMCDRVAIINQGRIIAAGTLAELRAMGGRGSLEDIFLQLTGGAEVAEMARELS